MKYVVEGEVTHIVRIEVEAENLGEAINKASQITSEGWKPVRQHMHVDVTGAVPLTRLPDWTVLK